MKPFPIERCRVAKDLTRGVNAAHVRAALAYNQDTGQFTWKIYRNWTTPSGAKAGTLRKDGKVLICLLGRMYLAHRLAWIYIHGSWPKGEVDHADRNKSNNAIGNLRDCSSSLNRHNRPRRNPNHPKGVYYVRRRAHLPAPFTAEITVHKTRYYLGYFQTASIASEAYERKARELVGEFMHDIRDV